jgi:hypothetical protein
MTGRARFLELVLRNPVNERILGRLRELNLPDGYLVAGCLYQSVWNGLSGMPSGNGIDDYDVSYFDPSDLSYEAEDAVIRRCADAFAGVDARIEVRNQARVHLWYPEKFGIDHKPLTSTRDGVETYLNVSSCFGVRLDGDGYEVIAPFGYDDLFAMIVRPNTRRWLPGVYEAKATRWRSVWPALSVVPWPTIEIVLGTTNASKLERMRALLARVNVNVVDATGLAVPVDEGDCVEENARRKARAYAAATGKPALGTDYGLTLAGLPSAEQPNAFVRRLRRDGAPMDDDALLEHYRRHVERLGGTAELTWTAGIALAGVTGDAASTTARITRMCVSTPSNVVRPGEPLASLQIDTQSGRYVSELAVEERAREPGVMDAAFLRFVGTQIPALAEASRRRRRGRS